MNFEISLLSDFFALMISRFTQCIIENCQMLPPRMYFWLGILLCLGTVSLWVSLGFRKGTRWAVGLLLVLYLFWIYCMTLIYRDTQAVRSFNLIPFWSYRAIGTGDKILLVQDIMNVVAFIPVGLLLGCSIGRMKLCHVLLAGVLLSFSIEILQFVFFRGFAEFDDLFHNTLGCLLGYGAYARISTAKE